MADAAQPDEQLDVEIKERFKAFLENEDGDYPDKIRGLIDNNKRRLMVNLHDLRGYDPKLAEDVVRGGFRA